jgi:hypothetical protein
VTEEKGNQKLTPRHPEMRSTDSYQWGKPSRPSPTPTQPPGRAEPVVVQTVPAAQGPKFLGAPTFEVFTLAVVILQLLVASNPKS